MLQRSFTPTMALVVFFAFLLVMTAVAGPVFRAWAAPHFDLTATRALVAFRITVGLFAQWIMFAVLVLVLKLRGQTLADIGWGTPSAIWGWLLALGLVGFFAWSAFRANPNGPGVYALDPHTWLTDWSFFRISLALGVAITVGVCEEVIFRGFVMNQARDAGAPLVLQIALSGILFGLAHISTAGVGGKFDFVGAFSAVLSTTVFGVLFGIAFVLGGRSLTPVIVAHGIFGLIFEPWMVLAIAERAARIHT
jgi:membrane protease YdiL (CAAX protease family)